MNDKPERVNSWQMPAIAALMLVGLVIIGLFINGEPRKLKQKVLVDNTRIQSTPITQTPVAEPKAAITDSPASALHKQALTKGKKIIKPVKAAKPIAEANTDLQVEKPTADEIDATPLDESLVMAYSAEKKTSSINTAHPQAGWDSYDKYVNDKAIAADGKAGLVIVSFTVNGNGSLTDIKVTKSLNEAVDKAAIDIIKNGPTWVGEANGLAKTKSVKVNFH